MKCCIGEAHVRRAWVAVADSSDRVGSAVREAQDAWLSAGGLLLTTDYVIDETLTTIRFRLGLVAFIPSLPVNARPEAVGVYEGRPLSRHRLNAG